MNLQSLPTSARPAASCLSVRGQLRCPLSGLGATIVATCCFCCVSRGAAGRFPPDKRRSYAPGHCGAGERCTRGRCGAGERCLRAAPLRPVVPARLARSSGVARAVRRHSVVCLRTSEPAPQSLKVRAWTTERSIQSLGKVFLVTGSATTAAYFCHPYLLNTAAHVLNLDFRDSVTAFQTSFFSFLSLVFAIFSGNTMAFLYDRQKEVVKNLYAECMALEELLEESVNTLGPDARDILAQIRLYIEQEIFVPENQSPPLGEGHALATIRAKARNYRRAGTDVGEILQASQRLAHAQSERQATACRLLPPVHWALLYTVGSLFVATFILFETGGSFSNEGRHILFTVLCGVMSFVIMLLRDLADPAEGIYNATALLGERLSYITTMLNKYEKLPVRAPTSSTVLGTSVPAASLEDALRGTPAGTAPAAPSDAPSELGTAPEDAPNEGDLTGVTATATAALRGMFAPSSAAQAEEGPLALPVAQGTAAGGEMSDRREGGNSEEAASGAASQRPPDTRPAPRRTLTRVASLDNRTAAFHWPRPSSRAVVQRSANTVR